MGYAEEVRQLYESMLTTDLIVLSIAFRQDLQTATRADTRRFVESRLILINRILVERRKKG